MPLSTVMLPEVVEIEIVAPPPFIFCVQFACDSIFSPINVFTNPPLVVEAETVAEASFGRETKTVPLVAFMLEFLVGAPLSSRPIVPLDEVTENLLDKRPSTVIPPLEVESSIFWTVTSLSLREPLEAERSASFARRESVFILPLEVFAVKLCACTAEIEMLPLLA